MTRASLPDDVNQTQFPKYVYFIFLKYKLQKSHVGEDKAVPLCAKQSQRGGRGISLSKLNPAVRREKLIGATLRPLCCQGRDPVLFVQGLSGPWSWSGCTRKTVPHRPGLGSYTDCSVKDITVFISSSEPYLTELLS